MISQTEAEFIIISMQLERSRLGLKKVNPQFLKVMDKLIKYCQKQLKEARTPNEIDRLINKISTW